MDKFHSFLCLFDGSRELLVMHGDSSKRAVQASSETGQVDSGTKTVSKTFKWERDGLQYRVQVQVKYP